MATCRRKPRIPYHVVACVPAFEHHKIDLPCPNLIFGVEHCHRGRVDKSWWLPVERLLKQSVLYAVQRRRRLEFSHWRAHDPTAHKEHLSATPRPAQAPTPRGTPAPRPTRTPTNTPFPSLLLHNLLLLRRPLFLSPPMTSLLIVFADSKRSSEPLALLDLSLCKLVDLMAFKASCARSTAVARLLGGEFLAQGVALVVY